MKEVKINKKIAEKVKALAEKHAAYRVTIEELSLVKLKVHEEMWGLINRHHPNVVKQNTHYDRVKNALILGEENP